MRVEASARFKLLSLVAIGGLLMALVQPEAPGQSPSAARGGGASLRLKTPEEPAASSTAAPMPVTLEPLSFCGVKIGVSTLADVSEAWGKPQKSSKADTVLQQTFAVEPYERIEATFYRDVILSATIVLRESLPVDDVVRELALSGIEAVSLRDLDGKPAGRGYPERGVSLLFDDPIQRTVRQIMLDALDAQPFAQRGERRLSREPSRAVADATLAIEADDRSPRAWRLKCEALLELGLPAEALSAAEKARELEPDHPAPRILLARIKLATDKRTEARTLAEEAIKLSTDRPEWKAASLVCLGTVLLNGPVDDVQRALNHFQQAITTADTARNSQLFEVRRLASETMIEAHLGAADAISRATWQNKPLAVSRWLEQAVKLAQETYANDPDPLVDSAFEIGARATEISLQLGGQLDVRAWADDCRTLADQRLAGVTGAADRARITRGLVMAYDHVTQGALRRKDFEVALKYAQQAVDAWQAVAAKQTLAPPDKQLLGELLFRVGSCHALGKQDHTEALVWFERARPHLELAAEQPQPDHPGQLGECLVSMAVSYWAAGKQQPALDLTERGLKSMEKAVSTGQLDRSALTVPYGNLARMHKHRGEVQKADEFQVLAGRADGKLVR